MLKFSTHFVFPNKPDFLFYSLKRNRNTLTAADTGRTDRVALTATAKLMNTRLMMNTANTKILPRMFMPHLLPAGRQPRTSSVARSTEIKPSAARRSHPAT